MSARIYVGNLPLDIKERELEDLFYKYGKIRSIDVKTPSRPPAYAFVEFDDPLDAQDACRGRDGYNFYDNIIRVEPSMGSGRGGPRGGPPRGGYGGGSSSRSLGPSPFGPSRRTDFRVIVTGLPISASWQDLKDHMRRAGEVTFTQVMRDGRENMGLVDFAYEDDLLTALDKLDKSEFKNPFDRCIIRVKEDRAHFGGSRRRSRSRSPIDSRSRSRSPRRSLSRSRSRSPVRRDSRSRSRSPRKDSRSRSRSPAKSDRSRSRSRSRSASR